jgi:putative endonuclease
MLFNEIKTKAAHLLRGESSEALARRFLTDAGLKLVAQNYRCKQGELDLIMLDGQTLVVVEVRFRKSDRFGGAASSVTKSKQARIIAATQVYLSSQKTDRPIRFDVVALAGNGNIHWIKNAFQA